MRTVAAYRWFAVLAAASILAGCGKRDVLPLLPVTGTVSYQGKLLDRGEVVFTPQSGTPGPPAIGKIRPDGSFVMETMGRRGATLGEHKVTVHCRRELSAEEISKRSLVVPQSLIPDKYWKQDLSPLRFVVQENLANVYDIRLD